MNDTIRHASERMDKCIQSLKDELTKLRTGRAHPSLLDQLMVDYYGTPTPLSQVASVSVESAQTLMVTPWEKDMVAKIEKAIMMSDLGLNPASAGTVIRVPLPPLTEERRRSLTKLVRDEAEKARVAVRNIRRDANATLKAQVKEKLISEDDERRAQTDVQKVTDSKVSVIDQVAGEKEKEMMVV